MNKVLITGGAGYVGSVLTPYLLSKGFQITVLDLMIYGEKVLGNHKNLKVIKGDIRNKELLKKILSGHDTVIHLACISNDPSFELNPKLGKSINFDAFEPLVETSLKSGVKRFIYASSSSVYGIKKDKEVIETAGVDPLTDYSKYKVDCENILKKFYSNDFSSVIIRPATVCGYAPRQRLDVVVNILTNHAYNKREIRVFGGKQLRPNIHIFDMARAYELLLTADKSKISGKVFNAGYDNQTVNDIALTVKKIIGEDVKISHEDTNDDRSYHISSDKIKNELGFITQKNVEDAVKDLKKAFENKLLPNSFSEEKYFNIKRMNNLNLK